MKELNLKQMESVNGGLESDCKGASSAASDVYKRQV